MKRYNITVNGKTYAVEVEEVGGAISKAAPAPVQSAPSVPAEVLAPVAKVEPVQAVKNQPAVENSTKEVPIEGGEVISCPMPGTIIAVNVKPGDMVKTRDVLFVLEAMKMENEIMAPHDCRIGQVGVTKGAAVNTGDMLAVLI